jgi:hypothetical protein
MARTHFPGFQMPADLKADHEEVSQCLKRIKRDSKPHGGLVRWVAYAFANLRARLENLICSFFRKSKAFFRARLKEIRISVEHMEMRRGIQEMIGDIAFYARDRYIDIPGAATLYCLTYKAIEALRSAQADLEAAAAREGRELVWV